jgi:hypothetical protein
VVAGTARASADGGSRLAVSGEESVAPVTLIRLERRNALNVMQLLALEKASSDLRQAPGVREGTELRIAERQCALRRALRNVTLDRRSWN